MEEQIPGIHSDPEILGGTRLAGQVRALLGRGHDDLDRLAYHGCG